MNFSEITNRYYSYWLGTDITTLYDHEIRAVYSQERNVAQYGYGQPFDIYIFFQNSRIIISYGDKAMGNIKAFQKDIPVNMSIAGVSSLMEFYYSKIPYHGIKFIFKSLLRSDSKAIQLTAHDFPLYLEFFKQNNPCIKDNHLDWLQEYFEQNAMKGMFCGVTMNGSLVSCTDAPGMPYMENQAQEIGINTLPNYRGRGYARQACLLALENMLANNLCPQWSTSIDNTASQKLASSIGFSKFAEVLTITI